MIQRLLIQKDDLLKLLCHTMNFIIHSLGKMMKLVPYI